MNNTANTNILSDEVIAADLLVASKKSITSYAAALAEAASPQVRELLKKQLAQAITMHERVFNYVANKGNYLAYDLNSQLQMDLQNAQRIIDTIQ